MRVCWHHDPDDSLQRVLVRAWNSNHVVSSSTSSSSAATTLQPIDLQVTSYQDLRDKVTSALFSSQAGSSPPFILYYLKDNSTDRWWYSREKVQDDFSLRLYVSQPLNDRPILLLWNPPVGYDDGSHDVIGHLQSRLPLSWDIPGSFRPPPYVDTNATLSSHSSSESTIPSYISDISAEGHFAEAVRRRDGDFCIVCKTPNANAAHVVPVDGDRSVKGQEQAGLYHLYDTRNGINLCQPCHIFFDRGLWCIDPKDRVTIIVSKALLSNEPQWKERQGKKVKQPSNLTDWPTEQTLKVQYDFFKSQRKKRRDQRYSTINQLH